MLRNTLPPLRSNDLLGDSQGLDAPIDYCSRLVIHNLCDVRFNKIDSRSRVKQFMKLWVFSRDRLHDYRSPLVRNSINGRVDNKERPQAKDAGVVECDAKDPSIVGSSNKSSN